MEYASTNQKMEVQRLADRCLWQMSAVGMNSDYWAPGNLDAFIVRHSSATKIFGAEKLEPKNQPMLWAQSMWIKVRKKRSFVDCGRSYRRILGYDSDQV
jgi:hypothetical protein